MFRRLIFACAMMILASSAVTAGCSIASNPGVQPNFGAHSIRENPQSIVHWKRRAGMPTARSCLAAGVVNGALYAIGGVYDGNLQALKIVEAYDAATNTWAVKAHMPTARYCLAAGAVNGILYVIGGYGSNDASTKVEAYDPAADAWTTKANMPTGRAFLAAGVVNGILYAVGGSGPFGTVDTVEAYDPTTDTWTTKRSMPKPREALAVGVVNGILYAVGGAYCPYALSCSYKSSLYAYDPATDTWTEKAAMPKGARFGLAAGDLGGRLYAVGGNTGNGAFNLNRLESYDPATNKWAENAPMPTPRVDLAAGVVSGEMYAVGGSDIYGIGMHTLQAFNPQ